jgi:hypothetical protein
MADFRSREVAYLESLFTNPQPIKIDIPEIPEVGVGLSGELIGIGQVGLELTIRPDFLVSALAGAKTPIAGPSAYVGSQFSLADGITGKGFFKPIAKIGGGATVSVFNMPVDVSYDYDPIDGTHGVSAGPGLDGLLSLSGTLSYKPKETALARDTSEDPDIPSHLTGAKAGSNTPRPVTNGGPQYDPFAPTAVMIAQQRAADNPHPSIRDYPIELMNGSKGTPSGPPSSLDTDRDPSTNIPSDMTTPTSVMIAHERASENPHPAIRDYPIELMDGSKGTPSSPITSHDDADPDGTHADKGKDRSYFGDLGGGEDKGESQPTPAPSSSVTDAGGPASHTAPDADPNSANTSRPTPPIKSTDHDTPTPSPSPSLTPWTSVTDAGEPASHTAPDASPKPSPVSSSSPSPSPSPGSSWFSGAIDAVSSWLSGNDDADDRHDAPVDRNDAPDRMPDKPAQPVSLQGGNKPDSSSKPDIEANKPKTWDKTSYSGENDGDNSPGEGKRGESPTPVKKEASSIVETVKDWVSSFFPVALDLDGNGTVEVKTRDESGVRFAWEKDGDLLSTAWVGAKDGFLMIDEGGDGQLTDASEIAFAERTAAEDTDMEALRALFDSNHDDLLDANDADWLSFTIWNDANQNGITDQGEVMSLADHGILSIGLVSDGKAQVLEDGSIIHGASQAELASGAQMVAIDVALRAGDDEGSTASVANWLGGDTFLFNTREAEGPTPDRRASPLSEHVMDHVLDHTGTGAGDAGSLFKNTAPYAQGGVAQDRNGQAPDYAADPTPSLTLIPTPDETLFGKSYG